jgi:xylulokinase
MWVAALDLLLERVKAGGFELGRIAGISGAGQQHGSVYLNAPLGKTAWRASAKLADQLAPLLSRPTTPIWMDSSTSAE